MSKRINLIVFEKAKTAQKCEETDSKLEETNQHIEMLKVFEKAETDQIWGNRFKIWGHQSTIKDFKSFEESGNKFKMWGNRPKIWGNQSTNFFFKSRNGSLKYEEMLIKPIIKLRFLSFLK